MNLQIFFITKALEEYGIVNADIKTDHIRGLTFVNGVTLGIKYPLEYIEKINNLNKDKLYEYCFLGMFGKERGNLLEKFIDKNSKIENNRNGRDPTIKYSFDAEYYQTISNTKYSLCPNQGSDSKYKHEYGWTYRLIETVFCRSVPVAFRATPYGSKFIKDIKFLWDDENHYLTVDEYTEIIDMNYKKALTWWVLQPDEIELIKNGSNAD